MLANIVGWVVMAAVAMGLGWLTWRAWRIRRGLLRWPAVVVGGLLTLVAVLVAVVTGRGLLILYWPNPAPAVSVSIASTPGLVARGEHLAATSCVGCHSAAGTLPLSGGGNFSAEAGLPLGDVYPPNITPGGSLAALSDADIWRIFRYGVFPNGRATLMPLAGLSKLSDDDLKAIIAYLHSQPAVEHVTPPTNPSLLMAVFIGAGMFNINIEPQTGPVSAPAKGPTAEYGNYIISYIGCRDCHGEQLDGNVSGPAPAGPSLRIVQGWTAAQFIATLRTGVDPSGHALQPPMPWEIVGRLDDEELTAVYQYLASLPPAQ